MCNETLNNCRLTTSGSRLKLHIFVCLSIDMDIFRTVKVQVNKAVAVCCEDTAMKSNLLNRRPPDINSPLSVISVNNNKFR